MAVKQYTQMTDDLDGSTDGVETVKFGLWGRAYEVDLNEHHRGELAEALAPFTDVARLTSGKSGKPVAARGTSGVDVKAVRKWAEENGIAVAPRGRVSADVIAKYLAA